MRIVFNVIASVGRQIDVYRPIKIQKSYRPTVIFNVIAALLLAAILLQQKLVKLAADVEDKLAADVEDTLMLMSRSTAKQIFRG